MAQERTARERAEVRREEDMARIVRLETDAVHCASAHAGHAREIGKIWKQIDTLKNRLPVWATLAMTGMGAAIGFLARWVLETVHS